VIVVVLVVYLNEFVEVAPQTPPAGGPRFSIDVVLLNITPTHSRLLNVIRNDTLQ